MNSLTTDLHSGDIYTRLTEARRRIREQRRESCNCCAPAALPTAYFQRLFHGRVDASPCPYLTGKRYEQALQLLRTGYAVAETAYTLGFPSTAAFCTWFRRYAGIPPTVFREKAGIKE